MQEFLRRRKTIGVKSATIVLFGTPRSGKTTVLKRLTEDPSYVVSEVELPSTGLADKPIRVLIKKPSAAMSKRQGTKIVPQDFDEATHYLAKQTFRAASQLQSTGPIEQPKHELTHVPQAMPPEPIAAPQSSDDHASGGTNDQPLTPTPTEAPSGSSDPTNPTLSFLTPNDIMGEATQSPAAQDIADLEGCTFVYILDTGGQPELFEVLPPFLSGSTINILIFRLIDELGKRYKVRYVSPEGEHVEEYDSSFMVY